MKSFRAQRLLASKVWAAIRAEVRDPGGACSTPTGIKGLGSDCLNGSCIVSSSAQRLLASKVWAGLKRQTRVSLPLCSTPTGIKGLGSTS